MSNKKIGLDIGHGVNTFPGGNGVTVNGKGYAEHNFNSKVGIRAKELLENSGVEVVFGQEPYQVDVALARRTQIYENAKVDLVASIHADANDNANASGRYVFYWHTDAKAKKLAEMFVEEYKRLGYSLRGDGLQASQRGNWTNLHIVREHSMTSILAENGFMTNAQDFQLIFGSKQDEYAEDIAQVYARAICKYLGVTFKDSDSKPSEIVKPPVSSGNTSNNSGQVKASDFGGSIVNYLNSRKINSSLSNRKKLAVQYGVSSNQSQFTGKADQNTALLNAMIREQNGSNSSNTSAPTLNTSVKTINQMAQEVIDGKHGNGHDNRRKSLGISQSEYDQVRTRVNQLASGSSGNTTTTKTVEQMAREVIAGQHGNGHVNRQRSLGVTDAVYQQVRNRVNQLSK